MNKGKECSTLMVVLMVICVLLSLTTLGIVAYDRFIRPNAEVASK